MLMGIKWEYERHILSTCGNSRDFCVDLYHQPDSPPFHSVEEKMDEK